MDFTTNRQAAAFIGSLPRGDGPAMHYHAYLILFSPVDFDINLNDQLLFNPFNDIGFIFSSSRHLPDAEREMNDRALRSAPSSSDFPERAESRGRDHGESHGHGRDETDYR
ncbi:hypothetical protein QU487_15055 [Crenobacter sp. SG2305]|uniref:hypothetical protein n=1 Tax=Crenobacter oryzisoli TaxID=3056844 RepID=UPI0025AABCFB|nr:hypothetical protein [Crenobacter sp. SG2305]MDN0084056.1 hypothetical protein [Crenobacter sp. SG2305]